MLSRGLSLESIWELAMASTTSMPASYLAKDGISGGQRVILVHNKELTAIGIGTGIGHGNGSARIATIYTRRFAGLIGRQADILARPGQFR